MTRTILWINYYKHPMVLEDFIKSTPLYGYEKRTEECVRTDTLENNPGMSLREKLGILAKSRFAVCAKKSHTRRFLNVELLATGTVPVVDHEHDMSPLTKDVHYLVVEKPTDPIQTIMALNREEWTRMSEACKDWYARNAHSSVSWERTLRRVLYDEELL